MPSEPTPHAAGTRYTADELADRLFRAIDEYIHRKVIPEQMGLLRDHIEHYLRTVAKAQERVAELEARIATLETKVLK